MPEPDPDSARSASPGDASAEAGGSDRGLSDRSRWNAGRRVEVGERVVVRRHLMDGETSHLYTDVIGHVVELEPELVVRRGSTDAAGSPIDEDVRIPDADIAVLKVLPAKPVRAREVRELEYAGALAWPGTESALVDGWFCRAGDDWSYRAGAAVPVLPWASCEDLDGVRDWYAARGLPLRLVDVDRLVHADRLTLDGARVDPARVTAGRDLHLCTADSAGIVATVDDRRRSVTLAESPDDDWLALYHGTAGLDPAHARPAMLAVAALADGDSVPGGTDPGGADGTGPGGAVAVGAVAFARFEDETGLAAIARGAVTAGPDGAPRIAVSCVETATGHRRRGLAEVVTAALADWGLGLGAQQCHLHVFDDNTAGRALWAKLGFAPHYSLRHLRVD